MAIPAIPALPAFSPTAAASIAPSSTATTAGLAQTQMGTSGGADFANMLAKGINAVETTQAKADTLAVQAATGNLTNIHDYTIAATQASLITSLATAIRTKGVDAINTLMGMQA